MCGGSAREFVAAQPLPTEPTVRPFVVALAYLLGGFTDFHRLGTFNRLHLACLIFGEPAVEESLRRASELLDRWGYRDSTGVKHRLRGVFSQALLLNRSPRLDDLDTAAFDRAAGASGDRRAPGIDAVCAAAGGRRAGSLRSAGAHRLQPRPRHRRRRPGVGGLDRALARHLDTDPEGPRDHPHHMAKTGRWLAAEHPEITEPGQWTRATCAEWVAAVDRMTVGDYVQRRECLADRAGDPDRPAHQGRASSRPPAAFFRDCQEWEWIGRRFDPNRALAVPRSVAALIGTNPRVIADDVWAKLLWAGLNLDPADLPGNSADTYYPMELIRAVTLTWLFSGLRSDEISRLRVGCIRWQHDGLPIPGDSREILAEDAVCLLDVPVHKTGTAFTKPVDPIVGQAIEAWQALRPDQPKRLDRKTAERVDMLFSVRAQPVAKEYINHTIIPALCGKAGVPTADVRGNITSHRARSTIASQLYNAKEPMTLFELQAWLGHRTPNTTQHYAKITPNTLSKAYSEAGYFARNVRAIEVLVDRDAVASGAAAAGEPWQHYDLGHGWCTYSFFEQCPHRMACARCDFYTPKGSTKAQLLEAKDNLQRMRASIPLTDEERAAVDDGHAALDALLNRLADVPTPAGPTPHQIGTRPTPTMLPITQFTRENSRT